MSGRRLYEPDADRVSVSIDFGGMSPRLPTPPTEDEKRAAPKGPQSGVQGRRGRGRPLEIPEPPWAQSVQRDATRSVSDDRAHGRCYFCHESGHLAADCPSKRAAQQTTPKPEVSMKQTLPRRQQYSQPVDPELNSKMKAMRKVLGLHLPATELNTALISAGGDVKLAISDVLAARGLPFEKYYPKAGKSNPRVRVQPRQQPKQSPPPQPAPASDGLASDIELQEGVQSMQAIIGDVSGEVLSKYLLGAGGNVERAINHYLMCAEALHEEGKTDVTGGQTAHDPSTKHRLDQMRDVLGQSVPENVLLECLVGCSTVEQAIDVYLSGMRDEFEVPIEAASDDRHEKDEEQSQARLAAQAALLGNSSAPPITFWGEGMPPSPASVHDALSPKPRPVVQEMKPEAPAAPAAVPKPEAPPQQEVPPQQAPQQTPVMQAVGLPPYYPYGYGGFGYGYAYAPPSAGYWQGASPQPVELPPLQPMKRPAPYCPPGMNRSS